MATARELPETARATPTIGAVVHDPAGELVGTVTAVGLDPTSARSEWLVIELLSQQRTALPTYVASLSADGSLVVPFGRAVVESAPGSTGDVLTAETAVAVLSFYGLTA